MKPGSLVVCLNFGNVNKTVAQWVKWCPIMDENTPYVIKSLGTCPINGEGVTFEEGIIGYNPHHKNGGGELMFPITHVREIQPPCSEEISEICRDAQENYSLIEK